LIISEYKKKSINVRKDSFQFLNLSAGRSIIGVIAKCLLK